jgi:hypothetical protein
MRRVTADDSRAPALHFGPQVHEQLIASFNTFVGDVERSYATNGAAPTKSSARGSR